MSAAALPVQPTPDPIIPMPISTYAGLSNKLEVGYLPDVQVQRVAQLQGSITWGDGSTTPAEFDRDKKGGIDVVGLHTYKTAGTYKVSTNNITQTPNYTPGQPYPQYILLIGSINTTADVATAPTIITEKAGKPFTANLGTFNQFTLDIIFTATVNWGDSHVNFPAKVTGGDLAQGNWTVQGTHTYAHTGLYKVTADVFSQIAPRSTKSLAHEFDLLIDVVS
jgi:hypothetical protein